MSELSISVFETDDMTAKIISTYKITKDTPSKDIKNCILKYILNNMFNQLITFGYITKENDLYIFGNYKTHNKIDIMNYIINDTENKFKLQKMIDCLFNSIENYFQIENNNLKMEQNGAQIQKIIKINEKLEKKKEKLMETIDTRNSENLDIIYKQHRLRTEMENEIYDTDLHITNIGADTHLIIQTYESQKQKKASQIIKRQTQLQTEDQNRLEQRHDIENLEQDVLNDERIHKNEEATKEQLEQTNRLQQKILNENIGLRNDLNQSFVKIIDVMNEQNNALITTIETTSKSTQSVIDQTSKATADTITASGKSIQDTIIRETAAVQETIKQNAQQNIAKLNEVSRLLVEQNRQKEEMNRKLDQILAEMNQRRY
jgi:hypothetical protein